MNKKLGRLLHPSLGGYVALLFAFAFAAVLVQSYLLASAEAVVAIAALTVHLAQNTKRRKRLQEYVQSQIDEITHTSGAKTPFPLLVVRLADNGIVYANDLFVKITGFQDRMTERTVSDVLPGFSTEWLSAGKTEYAYDVTLEKRRYRVYGNVVRANDPAATHLGVLYFNDLTELYQVRDEYIRSRPVVSIVLVDNYDELTKNLSEGAISAMNARINDCINQWCSDYHGLLRRDRKSVV